MLRTTYPTLSGAGVTVGILSDSFNCYGVYDQPGSGVPATGTQGYAPFGFATDDATFDESNGYLAASVNVLEEAPCTQYGQPLQLPFTDEGRAMLQIVHDVAPGAALAFYTADNSEADFANGIGALATPGRPSSRTTRVTTMSRSSRTASSRRRSMPFMQKGVAYFSAAGNDGQQSYENNAPSFATPGTGANAGESLLNFRHQRRDHHRPALPVTIPDAVPR